MRKYILLFFIALAGFLIYAESKHFFVAEKTTQVAEIEESSTKQILLNDFYKSELSFKNSILLGGGSDVIVFDTMLNKVKSRDQFINESTSFEKVMLNIEDVKEKSDNETISAILFDFASSSIYDKLLKIKVNRGFYLGIYREFLEDIQIWKKDFNSIILSSAIVKDIDGQEKIIVILKAMKKSKIFDVAFLFPLVTTENHIYDFTIRSGNKYSTEINNYLKNNQYSFTDQKTIRRFWKIDSKKFELRNVKWNFD